MVFAIIEKESPPFISSDLDLLDGKSASTFHTLLFVHADDTSARVLRIGMLQKGFNVIVVETLAAAKARLLEDENIELVICDLSLTDGTALDLFHDLQHLSKIFQGIVELLPFFILTDSNDLATEYCCRHLLTDILGTPDFRGRSFFVNDFP